MSSSEHSIQHHPMNNRRYEELKNADHQHLWHPFTQMRTWLNDEPIVIERGEGNYLIDVNGRRYLDGVSSLWCNVHGHRKAELDKALSQQTERIAHSTMLGLSHEPAIELAELLLAVAPPGLTRVFYSDSGSTAVEIALKMAFQWWAQRGQRELAAGQHGLFGGARATPEPSGRTLEKEA